jgi:polyketide cyclase/dehydrase/lipid transport protein
MVTRIDLYHDVLRPPDEVFAALIDFSRLTSWRTLESLRVEPEGPVQPGTRLYTTVKGPGRPMRFSNEVTVVDPIERCYDDRALDGTFLIESGWTVEPQGEGSRIHWSTRFTPRGAMKVLTPVLQRAIRRGQLADLDRFSRLLTDG